ncbi:MAG: alpha-amylase family glycosyl hydrolase [Myxococcota bacterium]|nr:alpha-amylase family glycosyl hydrolase [Myxococcota bacterium]
MSEWWKSAVVYQIYPRSFCDASGDGVGDLEGIRRRLDHLVWLGVDAIWLSPFFRSPMKDYGYDVADHCDVDPLFGNLDDFDRLLAEAHGRGLRVVIDWVPNHTSDRHPWFEDARRSRESAKRSWYVWRDGSPDQPPNNWRSAFSEGPTWSWDEATSQWYLHLFLPEQPDLDWENPEVVSAMHDTLRFWLDRGVDGFRMDVIHCIGKDPALADVDENLRAIPYCALHEDERTHALLRGIRGVLAEYPRERVAVGEIALLTTEQVARYYGQGDQLHLAFNFRSLFTPWEAGPWGTTVEEVEAALAPRGAWPSWFLSNHDCPRHRTRYGSEARARAAAVLLLTLRGTPFLYAGEELGLEDAEVPPERVLDPGGRDGCRAPIPWETAAPHGWASADPWLPWPPEREERSVERQRADEGSVLHLYRRLLEARRASPALRLGSWQRLAAPEGVLAFLREHDGDRRAVVVNFTGDEQEVSLPGTWTVEMASLGSAGGRLPARVLPHQALLLR